MKKSLIFITLLTSVCVITPAIAAERNIKTSHDTKTGVIEKKLAAKKIKAKKAAPKKEQEKAEIESGSIYYDKENDTVVFEDKVSMNYKGKKLSAHKVIYNRTARLITAEEGVKLEGATGNSFVAEKMIVDDELKRGALEDVKATMKDGSVIFSDELKILDKEKYLLKKSSYSPCKPCEDGKYLWSIVADKILYDETEGKVTYRDTKIKVFDQTVGWTPYISHPTPYAKSKSGLLAPSFGSSTLYGTFLSVPYYWQPYEYMDFTFSPTYMSEDGFMLKTEYRQKFYSGDYLFRTSGIYPENGDETSITASQNQKNFRGHLEGEGRFDLENLIGKYWTLDFSGKRASDDTYLQRYNLGYEDYLTSVANVQKIKDRDFIQFSTLSFQGLRLNDDPDVSPLILPSFNIRKSYKLDTKIPTRLDAIGNALVLRRKEGPQVTRGITGVDWNSEYLTNGGHILNFSLLNRVDYYLVDNQPYNNSKFNGNVARYIPQASIGWNYPLYNTLFGNSVVVEPVAIGIISPYGLNDDRIPVEDSQNIEIFDYNLFQANHTSGFDLVETGPRINYGLKTIFNQTFLGDISTIVGQNYRVKKDPNLTIQSGMDDYLSDYVGRVSIEGNQHFNTSYSTRVDKETSKIKRGELSVFTMFDPITVNTTHTFVDGNQIAADRQEILGDIRYKIDSSWAVTTRARRNLNNDNNSGWVNFGSTVEWSNECLSAAFGVDREFTRDRDIQPDTRFMFTLNLANLGS